MATLLIPDLDEALHERLRARAKERGRSPEEEAREILEDAIEQAEDDTDSEPGSGAALWRRLRAGLPEDGVDFGEFPDTPHEPSADVWGEGGE